MAAASLQPAGQALLLGEEWWDSVIRGQEGVSEPNQRIVAFTVRQLLDMLSPSNVPWLNPEVIEAIQKTGGRNLIAGLENFLRDSAGAARPDSRLARISPSRRARSSSAMN